MSNPAIKRRRRLFPRTIGELVSTNTAPLMSRQGKLYGALLRDWEAIVGKERAAVCRPERLQFPSKETQNATLHLTVRPAAAPEMAYVTEQLIEQCARYFGYRAITRIVLHASHGVFTTAAEKAPEPKDSTASFSATTSPTPPLPETVPEELRDVLSRLARYALVKPPASQ